VVVPYWKETAVVAPRGLTDPLRVAEELVTNVAGLVVTAGVGVGVNVAFATVIVPTIPILQCGVQKYGNVPAVLKVWENVAPFPRSPESQSPLGAHEEPEVQVCPFSFKVHCTVSPGWIVTDEGEKESSPFPTVTITVAALPRPNDRPRATAIVATAVILRNEELFMISFG